MENITRITKTEAEMIEASFSPAAYATLCNKGLEQVIEASKSSLDSAVEQSSEVLASCKQVLKASSRPVFSLLDMAGQAFEGQVTLQKSLLDLAMEHRSAADSEAAQPPVTAPRAVVVFRRTPPSPRIRAAS